MRHFIITTLVAGALALSVAPACTKEQGLQVQTDLGPVEACATNALADALITGVTDPLAIIASCADLTLQALANVVRDMLAAPTQQDAGTGLSYVRTGHLLAVQKNLQSLGVRPQ